METGAKIRHSSARILEWHFMAYANYSNAKNGHGFYGLSCIVDPSETSLARAGPTGEIIFANIDLSLAAKAREKIPFLSDQQGVLPN